MFHSLIAELRRTKRSLVIEWCPIFRSISQVELPAGFCERDENGDE